MATCTDSGASAASTSNTTSYASASFTPSANDLLVAFVTTTGSVLAAPTLTDSLGAITFTLVNQSLWSTSANSIYVFVADQLAAASARTVTFNCTGDAATGCIVQVCLVSGMTKTSTAAIRQSAVTNNGASGTTPTLTFSSAALTANPTLAMLGSGATLPARPTGYTAGASVSPSYSTPTTLANYQFLNSGDTLTTITWSANASGVYGIAGVELDTSAGTSAIACDISASASMSDTLTGTGALAGNFTASSTVASTLTGKGALAAAFSASATTGDTLTGIGALADIISASASFAASLIGSGALADNMSGSATLSGTMENATAPTVNFVGTSSLIATLIGSGALAAAINGSASFSALLSGMGALASDLSASASLSPSLNGIGNMTLVQSGTSSLTGISTGIGSISADLSGVSDVSVNNGGISGPSPWHRRHNK